MFGDYNDVHKRDNKITGATEFPCKPFKFMDFLLLLRTNMGVSFLICFIELMTNACIKF